MEHPANETTLEKILIQRAANKRQPINGSFELLPLCNMNCDMCYVRLSRAEMEQQGRLRTAEEWIGLARQMQRAGVLFLLLTGGEPLLFPDFRKLYLELKQMGMILTINTNGTLIDEDWAQFFGKNKPRRINITLYGADENAYQTLCHYPGGYAKTLRGMKLLMEQGVDVKINGSVTKRNLADTEAIYKIARELELPIHMDTYMLPGLHERDKPYAEQSRLNPKEAAEAYVQTLKFELAPDVFPQYAQQMLAVAKQDAAAPYTNHMTCLAGNCSFTINWQGEMRPCVSLPSPSAPVFETGFDAAWKTIVEETDRITLSPRCSQCSLRQVCQTCAACALLEGGAYDAAPDYMCQYTRHTLECLEKELAADGALNKAPAPDS